MRQGSTPTITLNIGIGDYDLSFATHIWVTFDQNGTQIVRKWERYPESADSNDGISVVGQSIIVKLSQAETLGFNVGSVEVQVKLKQDDFDETTLRDSVAVTDIKKLKVTEGINEDVM